ncbi:ImmA/IrrE family metallo-endopeptidase [Tsukamurella ocularis]|uniref:ImmA/IrrE family metallo-endopeptidase n=1 Tax=Tsukamurella ocularis TaxID=1970234 RepID=UPI0039EE2766
MNTPAPLTLSTLRRMAPVYPVNFIEAKVVAERQANRLAAAWHAADRSIRESDITGLSRIAIERRTFTAASQHSGSSQWTNGRWVIALNDSESVARQRFTTCHELKHIIDAGCSSTYSQLTEQEIERLCDHFAGCLLMSKRAIYRLWGDGLRTPEALATACRVSLAAMKVRLSVIGLPINSGNRGRTGCRRAFPSAPLPRTLSHPIVATTGAAP